MSENKPEQIINIPEIKGEISIIPVRNHRDFLEASIDYFASRWGIDKNIYDDCIKNSIDTESRLPRWFLLLKDREIIGGYGLIRNDFISRQDLEPWLCALYIEKDYRGLKLGSKLLEHGRRQATLAGYKKLYLATDHIGYYEKYGWRYLADGFHPWGDKSRIYVASSKVPDQ